MRVAVLSDIHGNLLALEAVLADLEAAGGADAVVIAGDLCLDGPRPRETLERLRALGYPLVQGNTDRDLALSPSETAESEQAELLDWTRQRLGEESVTFLRTLPFAHRVPDPTGEGVVLVVHANPKNLDDPLRPFASEAQIAPLLDALAPEVTTVVFGHLHLPFVREVGRVLLADISSVGLPKDGDRRAGYGVLTWNGAGWSVEQRRVEYAVEEVVAQLREADPPGVEDLIKMVLRARYPNMTAARGGRAPKRRATTSAERAARDPDDSEALVVQIGEGASVTPAAESVPVAAGVTAGEPIVAHPEADLPTMTTTTEAESVPSANLGAELMEMTDSTEKAIPERDYSGAAPVVPATDDAALAWATGEAAPGDEPDARMEAPASAPPRPEVTVGLAVAEGTDADTDGVGLGDDSDDDDDDEDAVEDDDQVEAAETIVAAGDGTAADRKRGKRLKKARRAAQRAATAKEVALLAADESFAGALPALLEARLAAVLAQLATVQEDEDPEGVHDMRVASRRLRAALAAAEPFFERKPFRRASRRVRALARALGQVRDADVLLAYLRERYMAVANDERVGIEGLIDAIDSDRAAARDDLGPVLDQWDENGTYVADFHRFALKAKSRRGKGKGRDLVRVVAARALDADLDWFEECAALLEDEGGDSEAFHTLRIAGKKLRYTIELFSPVLGADAEELLSSLKSLQELLGELHDRDVLIDLLAWERARALERQLHSLEFATFNPGTREERLAATRQILDAPDSFAATAPGTYGLLIDATMERDALEDQLRAHWGVLNEERFVSRLRDLADSLLEPRLEGRAGAPIEDEEDESTGE